MNTLIVRIDLGVHGRLGPGKLKLLQQIDHHGSISAAGRAMNMSYRQAWSLVDQLNQAFTEPVVSSQTGGKSGGGAALTEFGKLLVAHTTAIVTAAQKNAGPHIEFIERMLKPASANEIEPVAKSAPAKEAPFKTKASPQAKSKARRG